jgi:hypothetical protein
MKIGATPARLVAVVHATDEQTALADVIAPLVKILRSFLQSSAIAIKVIFGFNSTLIVSGSYFCHDDSSQAIARGRSLGCPGQFRSVCGRARSVADHAVLESTG